MATVAYIHENCGQLRRWYMTDEEVIISEPQTVQEYYDEAKQSLLALQDDEFVKREQDDIAQTINDCTEWISGWNEKDSDIMVAFTQDLADYAIVREIENRWMIIDFFQL